jgi:hypothetical protein
MIINAEQSNVQVLGDIKEFKTSIDPKNLEFITTLLSSNLYSDPEQSFIREIVSNAWDSHVEAKTTDIPVIVRFNYNSNNDSYEVTIRDFGTGLSPQRFQEVYCNIGSSTKRESNEYIGGFGIGKYSSLACSNTVYITSYYEGKAYIYIMVKSGNSITTNLVMEKPTEEKNGVEVTIKNIKNIGPYRRALKYIVFFPNVYIDGIENPINNTKIKKFNNFAVSSKQVDAKILLGNVLYQCEKRLLSQKSIDFLFNIENTGIVIRFNVGEIGITPNRESIIYSSDTVKKINDRIQAAIDELDGLVKAKFVKDYNNLYEFWSITHGLISYNPLDDTYSLARLYSYGYTTTVRCDVATFKGKTISQEAYSVLSTFFGMEVINFKGLFYNDKFYQAKVPCNAQKRTLMSVKSLLILTGNTRLTQIAKEWLHDNYNEYTIITEFTKADLVQYLASAGNVRFNSDNDIMADYMYDYLISIAEVLDINLNPDFQVYKATRKANKIPVKIKDVIIYQQKESYRESLHFREMSDCIRYLKRLKKGVILTDMQGANMWYDVAEARNLVFIRARKEIVDILNEIKPTFLVDKEWLLTEDKTIVKLHTILQTFGDGSCPTKYSCNEMLKTVPDDLGSAFRDIITFYYKFRGNITYKQLAMQKCTKIDSYVDSVCKQLKKYNEAYNNLSAELGLEITGEEPLEGLLMAAAIAKNRVYRVSPKTYSRIKNNKLLRVLCRK